MAVPQLFSRNRFRLISPPERESLAMREVSATVASAAAAASRVLPFRMQRQESGNWCWAAVTSSVVGYYQATAGETPNPPAQCELVSKKTGNDHCQFEFPNDDDTEFLESALASVHHLNGPAIDGHADFESGVRKDIDRDRPICVGIKWFDNTIGHFVCIIGYHQDVNGRFVTVVDPRVRDPQSMPFDVLLGSYHDAGEWVTTYFTIG